MRLRNVPGSREKISECKYIIPEDYETKGNWQKIFNNDNPIDVEIGMGKGTFIIEMAKKFPDINFIGIEKFSSVLVRAIEKLESANLSKNKNDHIDNLYFMRMDAEDIENYFEKDEISDIFLNFSDPWPKDRHAKRRLTSDRFLHRYENILKNDGTITFKTDNQPLFEFSVETANKENWTILKLSRDLHNSEYAEGNIMTEYEKKFSDLGNKINMIQISKK